MEYEKYACLSCGQVPDIGETFEIIKATMNEIRDLDVRIRGLVSLPTQVTQSPIAIMALTKNKIDKEQYLSHLLHESLPREVGLILGLSSYPPLGQSKPQPTAPEQQD